VDNFLVFVIDDRDIVIAGEKSGVVEEGPKDLRCGSY